MVVPVYNEDPVRVFAGLKATYESLEQTGFLPFFEFFILSDTTDADTWIREEMAFVDLRQVRQRSRNGFFTGIAGECGSQNGQYRRLLRQLGRTLPVYDCV